MSNIAVGTILDHALTFLNSDIHRKKSPKTTIDQIRSTIPAINSRHARKTIARRSGQRKKNTFGASRKPPGNHPR